MVFHSTAYSVFLLDFHPKIKSKEKPYEHIDFMERKNITQNYSENYIFIPDYKELSRCHSCKIKEDEYFYPFHKFYYGMFGLTNQTNSEIYYEETTGFLGIFGYYGHLEYIFYVIIPLIVMMLRYVYVKFIK